MKIDRITYSESIEIMEKKWIKTGAEGQLTDDEDPTQAMVDLKIFVREAIKKDYEDLQLLKNQWNPNWDHGTPLPEIQVDTSQKEADMEFNAFKNAVDSCYNTKDAWDYLSASPFKYSIEAKKYVTEKFGELPK